LIQYNHSQKPKSRIRPPNDYRMREQKALMKMKMKKMKKIFLAILAAGLMAGCSSEPSKPSETPTPKDPEAITGSSALYKCYISARGWAQDAQPFRAESRASTGAKGHDGKAGEWRVGFASPAQRATKFYTWANDDISHGTDDTYSPTNSSTQIFNVQFLKTDTDKAFAVAQQHGGDKLLEAEPDTPVLYVLDWNRQSNELLWHVIYGTDRDTAKLRVSVNASTGDFSRVEK